MFCIPEKDFITDGTPGKWTIETKLTIPNKSFFNRTHWDYVQKFYCPEGLNVETKLV